MVCCCCGCCCWCCFYHIGSLCIVQTFIERRGRKMKPKQIGYKQTAPKTLSRALNIMPQQASVGGGPSDDGIPACRQRLDGPSVANRVLPLKTGTRSILACCCCLPYIVVASLARREKKLEVCAKLRGVKGLVAIVHT